MPWTKNIARGRFFRLYTQRPNGGTAQFGAECARDRLDRKNEQRLGDAESGKTLRERERERERKYKNGVEKGWMEGAMQLTFHGRPLSLSLSLSLPPSFSLFPSSCPPLAVINVASHGHKIIAIPRRAGNGRGRTRTAGGADIPSALSLFARGPLAQSRADAALRGQSRAGR